MKHVTLTVAAAALLTANVAIADTLELADGTLLEGDMVGISNGIIMFDTCDGIEAYPEAEVVGIYLDEGIETREREAKAQAETITMAEGTRLMIRMSEAVDTRRHGAGHRFRGQLESSVVVDGVTVAPRGTTVYGRILSSSQSGNIAGSSETTIEFTDMLVDNQMHSMRTQGLQAQGQNEAGRTVARTARAAAIGGLISGRSGAKTGAKVGVGTAIITSGAGINIPAGTLVETFLAAPLTVPNPG